MLATKERLIGASLEKYIENELYWVLHAPRQCGKTTFLQSYTSEINAKGEAVASVEDRFETDCQISVVFDLRAEARARPWEERLTKRIIPVGNTEIKLITC
ncbi:MAG: hypothetical protein HQM10_25370 [Candidatus Riflebacteria bacterium]|nr:hypothetical protein [Candidatus Riflebacteria bacterium]